MKKQVFYFILLSTLFIVFSYLHFYLLNYKELQISEIAKNLTAQQFSKFKINTNKFEYFNFVRIPLNLLVKIIVIGLVLYKNPKVLILDEATSAMDKNTENFTINLIQKAKPNCAVLYISHRLNTLKNFADTICVLENKTISNTGSHEELLNSKNFYSDYFL